MDPRPRQVMIIAPQGASLAVALSAALNSRGWDVMLTTDPFKRADPTLSSTVVVAEDDEGRSLTDHRKRVSARGRMVCLGSVRSLPLLIRLATSGAIVLDQSTPFVLMVRMVEKALSIDRRNAGAGHPSTAMLLQRQAEDAALSQLTDAQDQVLAGLLQGFSATQIAADTHRSVHTVRSHINGLLGKLGVTSQVAAVAIAYRSWKPEKIEGLIRKLHQF